VTWWTVGLLLSAILWRGRGVVTYIQITLSLIALYLIIIIVLGVLLGAYA